jgi:hypothetical protein
MFRPLVLLAALAFCSACAFEARACEGSEIIFEDSFADDAGGWAVTDAVEVKDGTFTFKLPPDALKANLNVTFTVDDADVCSEVVWPEGGPKTLGAGLLFWGEDGDNYFQFGILNSGKYWIARRRDGKWLTIVENVDAKAIKTSAGDTNTLRVKTSGNTATFYINGDKLRDLRGQPPKAGWRFGISGDNFDTEKEARLSFNSVKVTN